MLGGGVLASYVILNLASQATRFCAAYACILPGYFRPAFWELSVGSRWQLIPWGNLELSHLGEYVQRAMVQAKSLEELHILHWCDWMAHCGHEQTEDGGKGKT